MNLYTQEYGIHPNEIENKKEEIDKSILEIEKIAKMPKVVAIGEIRT